jgi:DNA primase
MGVESLDFNDAVKFLAERVKMPLPEVKYDDEKVKEQKKQKQRLLDLLRDTALFYVKNLKSEKADKHVEYILKRKFTSETVARFGMGASLDFNGLPRYLKEKGYTYEEMVQSGACGEKNGRTFDWLGGRLIIPVIDQFNNVIAFDGRRIDGGKEQKYINTKETSVFFKGKTLFGLNNLKKVKNEEGIDNVIIVEGHLDVVTLYQAGFKNVVASMGTALTKDQARILKRYSDKIIISYDGDFAGQKAAIKGLEILSEEGLDVKVVTMPEGCDPDDVVKQSGAKGYRELLMQAKPLVDFKIDVLKKTFDLNSVDGKRKFISNAIRVIRESSSPAEQEDLLKTVRDLTGTTYETLKRELYSQTPEKPEQEKASVSAEFNDNTGGKSVMAARFILYSYLFNKPYALENDVNKLIFDLPVHKEIQKYISEKLQNKQRPKFNELFDMLLEDEKELSKIAGMETEENKRYDEAVYFNDCIRALKTANISKEIEMLNKMFSQETDSEKRREIAKKLSILVAEKNKV